MKWLFDFQRLPSPALGGLAMIFLLLSCNGDDDGFQVIDCQQEAALVGIEEDSAQGGMTVQFTLQYAGSLSVREVNWDFGDGSKGSGKSVAHLYVNSGTYLVRALAELGPGETACVAETTTSITIK